MSSNRNINFRFTRPKPFKKPTPPEAAGSSPLDREYHVYIRKRNGPQLPHWTQSIGGLETLLLKFYQESFAECVKQTTQLLGENLPTRLMSNYRNLPDQDLYKEMKQVRQDVVLEDGWWQFNPKWTDDFWDRITVFSMARQEGDVHDRIPAWFGRDLRSYELARHNWWGPYAWSKHWSPQTTKEKW